MKRITPEWSKAQQFLRSRYGTKVHDEDVDALEAMLIASRADALRRAFDEAGNACATIEVEHDDDTDKQGSAGVRKGARLCLRLITAVRERALGASGDT
jgi:hypothetical protein